MKNKINIVTLIDYNPITGSLSGYGIKEVFVKSEKMNETTINKLEQKKQQYALNIRRENTKHK